MALMVIDLCHRGEAMEIGGMEIGETEIGEVDTMVEAMIGIDLHKPMCS